MAPYLLQWDLPQWSSGTCQGALCKGMPAEREPTNSETTWSTFLYWQCPKCASIIRALSEGHSFHSFNGSPIQEGDVLLLQENTPGQDIHEVSTFNAAEQLRNVVGESNNETWRVNLSANISANDARAIDIKYHLPCWVKYVQRAPKRSRDDAAQTHSEEKNKRWHHCIRHWVYLSCEKSPQWWPNQHGRASHDIQHAAEKWCSQSTL